MSNVFEIFKHLTGLCGEPHPNIFILLGTPFATYIIYKLKKRKND